MISTTAILQRDVSIGEGTKIWHFSQILPGSKIGEGCNIGSYVSIGPDVTVGDHCKIQNNVSIYKGVSLGDNVFCGPSVVFTNVINPRAEIPRMGELRFTRVYEGATLGANSTIICGVTIGRYAFVGAGAVVTHNVPDHALVMGNPARQEGWVCECGVRLNEALQCPACGYRYEEILEEGLVRVRGVTRPREIIFLDRLREVKPIMLGQFVRCHQRAHGWVSMTQAPWWLRQSLETVRKIDRWGERGYGHLPLDLLKLPPFKDELPYQFWTHLIEYGYVEVVK